MQNIAAVDRLDRIADSFAALASQAGAVILAIYARGCSARAKADASPVTEADEAAEAVILPGLARLLPGVPVVAEEETAKGRAPVIGSGAFLLVDPLDGTREFLAANGEFTVNIALVEGGVPVTGVVYAPVSGACYLGGETARKAAIEAGATPGGARPIRTRPPPPDGLVAVGSRSHHAPETTAWLAARGIDRLTAAGSALKFGLVAEGLADVYPRFSATSEWDVAAGHAVLRAAGGDVVQPDGAPLRYGKAADQFRNGPFVAWGRLPAP